MSRLGIRPDSAEGVEPARDAGSGATPLMHEVFFTISVRKAANMAYTVDSRSR